MPTVKRKRDGDAGSSRRRARRRSNAEASSSTNPPTPSTAALATPAPTPAPTPALSVTHNIHHVANAGEARCCLNGSCVRCTDYHLLVDKARDEYDCVLVRAGTTPDIDNDDNDPDQPSYREDNVASDIIYKLEVEKKELQEQVESLRKHEKENGELGKHLESAKKETTSLRRQLTMAKKQTDAHGLLRKEHDRSITTIRQLQKAVDDGPEHVFVVLYKTDSGLVGEPTKDSVEIKGQFQKLDQANTALHHLCRVMFPRWRSRQVKDVQVPDDVVAHTSPGLHEVLRWQSKINEMRVVVGLPVGGKGFLWVEQRKMQRQTDLDSLQEKAKDTTKARKAEKAAKKAARKAAKNQADAMPSIETPLHSSNGMDLSQPDGVLSPLEEELFEGSPFTPLANRLAQPNHPVSPCPTNHKLHAGKFGAHTRSGSARSMASIPLPGSGPAPSASSPKSYRGRLTVVSLDRDSTAESDLRTDIRKHESTPQDQVAAGIGGSYRAPSPQMRIKSESASPASAPMKRKFFVGD